MDHYTVLGIPKTASADDIKKAYRKLASSHHPDKGGDTAKFQQIQAAYAILGDPEKRKEFDNPKPKFGGGEFHWGGTGDPFSGAFAEFFRAHQHQPQRPSFSTTVWVTLEQVATGGSQTLNLQSQTKMHAVTLDIPKGVQDGAQIRLDNVLEEGVLIVSFRIHPHEKFTRFGNDLHSVHEISVLELIIGSSFEFTTILGKTLSVTVPPKTQPNSLMRIAGTGLPFSRGTGVGDQLILLKPFMPENITPEVVAAIKSSLNK